MSGFYLKGALVSFMPTFIGSIPNVVIFQYNPETITHNWTAPAAASSGGAGAGAGAGAATTSGDPLAVAGVPGETFSFTLAFDAGDMIADGNPISAGLATVSGVYTRLAALEMLQYPSGAFSGGLLGTVSSAIGAATSSLTGSSGGATTTVPRSDVPVVLFVWGPQRIVPVRVTSLNITEKLYDTLLNPTHAEAQIGLRVLTPDEANAVQGEMKFIAQAAYVYSQGLRQVQAMANLGDAAASIIGMLPNPL
jgi:hypothetical protein